MLVKHRNKFCVTPKRKKTKSIASKRYF